MNRDEMIEIAYKMLKYGGLFERQIAGAILCADDINLKKLEGAFGDLIGSYMRFR